MLKRFHVKRRGKSSKSQATSDVAGCSIAMSNKNCFGRGNGILSVLVEFGDVSTIVAACQEDILALGVTEMKSIYVCTC